MLFGIVPYEENNLHSLLNLIQDTEIIIPRNRIYISKKSEDLLRMMLVKNPKERCTWDDLFNHEIMQDDYKPIALFQRKLNLREEEEKRLSKKKIMLYSYS